MGRYLGIRAIRQPGYSPPQPSMPVMPVPPMGDIQPEVAILSPQDGARIPLDREISIRVRATDDRALTRIEFLVDEAVFYAFEAAGQPFMDVVQTWRPTTPGVHVIDAIAFDDAWQASSPARIRVFVEGGGPVPMPTSWPNRRMIQTLRRSTSFRRRPEHRSRADSR